MSLVVNNNLMAVNTARNLNVHYGKLVASVQRLSSGLRINSAADDAAGLAIRELQRADIIALNQGSRNANDAISLIQVADGALSIIDEKLIRMKELAEQAATGTYTSTQRMLIESEYQQMASEITRIANATDFNGVKLLDGTLTGSHDGSKIASRGKLKIHFGTGNDSAEDYYYIEIGECTSQALGLGNASTWQDVRKRAVQAFRDSLTRQITENTILDDATKAGLLAEIDANVDILGAALDHATDYQEAWKFWDPDPANGFLPEGMKWPGSSTLMDEYLGALSATVGPMDVNEMLDEIVDMVETLAPKLKPGETIGRDAFTNGYDYDWDGDYRTPILDACNDLEKKYGMITHSIRWPVAEDMGRVGLPVGQYKTAERFHVTIYGAGAQKGVLDYIRENQTLRSNLQAVCDRNLEEAAKKGREELWGSLDDTERQKLLYAWGQAAIYNLANAPDGLGPASYGIEGQVFTFSDQDMLARALADMSGKVGQMDFAGFTIRTQEDAQMSLVAVNKAIIAKDNIRAYLGATQNRLENTITNINIQAENLHVSESRISDIDVATEMAQFVRNQILSQSAVAMLGQANSMPQMTLQLLGG